MKKLCVAFGLVLALMLSARVQPATAQAQTAQDSALAAFAKDLARLQQLVDSATWDGEAATAQSPVLGTMRFPSARVDAARTRDVWEKVMQLVREVHARWRDNPYIEIEGYTASVAWPPALNVRFKVKASQQ